MYVHDILDFFPTRVSLCFKAIPSIIHFVEDLRVSNKLQSTIVKLAVIVLTESFITMLIL